MRKRIDGTQAIPETTDPTMRGIAEGLTTKPLYVALGVLSAFLGGAYLGPNDFARCRSPTAARREYAGPSPEPPPGQPPSPGNERIPPYRLSPVITTPAKTINCPRDRGKSTSYIRLETEPLFQQMARWQAGTTEPYSESGRL